MRFAISAGDTSIKRRKEKQLSSLTPGISKDKVKPNRKPRGNTQLKPAELLNFDLRIKNYFKGSNTATLILDSMSYFCTTIVSRRGRPMRYGIYGPEWSWLISYLWGFGFLANCLPLFIVPGKKKRKGKHRGVSEPLP